MSVEIVETSRFSERRDRFFGDDDEYRRFQGSLAENPRRGEVIRGSGGIRKVRWREAARQKGKRGGLRIIYLFVEEADNILLLAVYDKDVAVDLAPAEKRALALVAEAYRTALLEARHKNHEAK